jgi:hypothetical protein
MDEREVAEKPVARGTPAHLELVELAPVELAVYRAEIREVVRAMRTSPVMSREALYENRKHTLIECTHCGSIFRAYWPLTPLMKCSSCGRYHVGLFHRGGKQ